MADTQHDNTNKGALWAAKGFGGKCDIDGKTFYVLMVATGAKSDNAPAYLAIVRDAEKRTDIVCPVFRVRKEGSKAAASFRVFDKVVFVYKAEASENENAPKLRLTVMADSAKSDGKAPAAKAPIDDSDLFPF